MIHAPSFDEITEKVASFFDEKTVIIGHNVAFDLRFLQRYAKAYYYTTIDTFPLAQALMPFSPSYALEVLAKNLKAPVNASNIQLSASHHDALYDAYATYKLFHTCIDRIKTIYSTYPEIDVFIARAETSLSSVMEKNNL